MVGCVIDFRILQLLTHSAMHNPTFNTTLNQVAKKGIKTQLFHETKFTLLY